MSEIRTYPGEVVSIFLNEEENTANIELDLGFRVWKTLNFNVGYRASYLKPRDKVIVDVEMRKEGREHSYRARDIRRDVQQDHPKSPSRITTEMCAAFWADPTLVIQTRSLAG